MSVRAIISANYAHLGDRMNSTLLAGGIATLLAIGLVVTVGAVSLLTGTFYFLFGKSTFSILRSKNGKRGFAFGYIWNSAREEAKFDKVRIRLYNPFGKPDQIDISHEFSTKNEPFAVDLEMGPGFEEILNAEGLEKATLEIELSSNEGVTMFRRMNGRKFVDLVKVADETSDEFNERNKIVNEKPVYVTVQRSFIADPLPASDKALKIATNPEFAGQFTAAASADATSVENFAVSKVWIEPGCIVCDACEGIYPEVFEVTADSCIIRPGAPLDNGLLVEEAAEACPVEVIKFTKA